MTLPSPDNPPALPGIRYRRAAPAEARAQPAPAIVQVGSVRLEDLARPGMRVVIAFTDATRHAPDRMLITYLLNRLAEGGVPRDNVTLLCATGLHRPMTGAECIAKLGAELAATMRIVQHDAMAPEGLMELEPIRGIPVVANRLCVEADLLLATGIVEPHQYAGYSGGAKTVVIGCGGERTIAATHGPGMLDREGVLLASTEGNPFQTFVRDAGSRIGLALVINALLGSEGTLIESAIGAPEDVHNHLVERARSIYEVRADGAAHCALVGPGEGKRSNLYQASRAVTYLALADRTPLLPGAPIVLAADLEEGAGAGTGEKRFADVMAGAGSPAALLEQLRRTGFPAGAQRAYVLAQALLRNPVIVAAPYSGHLVRACHMTYTESLAEALEMAEKIARERFGIPASQPVDCLVVPNALTVLPRLGEHASR
ncbi:MAG TPA: lactate racemase domain-containing protein [Candidatus Kapabacteria bacterium]|nr:lactate racemase domain-containing protein [Candidatus Kapabacteria bacterium]